MRADHESIVMDLQVDVPMPDQVQSWQNSLRAKAMVFQEAELDDHGVILEYE